ncbi:MAG: DUF4249 domain-containing protein [Bacteroidaceae bacterium]|nr:DUF4249 domain-containing protein [Bacteroidaceae bacterium]
MIKTIHNIIICLLFATLCPSCTEDDMITVAPQMVVEGWIDAGGFPMVFLSRTIPVSSDRKDAAAVEDFLIKWAKVVVSDGEREVVLTGKTDSNLYPPFVYTTGDMRGEPGKTYKLTVKYEDFYAEAYTTIPNPVSVERIYIDEDNAIKAVINDNPDEKNFYKFFIKVAGRDAMFYSSNTATIDDEEYSFPAEITLDIPALNIYNSELRYYEIQRGDIIHVKYAQIDASAYSFWNDYMNLVDVGRNPYFRYNRNPYSNVSGALGYWFGYGSTKYLLIAR